MTKLSAKTPMPDHLFQCQLLVTTHSSSISPPTNVKVVNIGWVRYRSILTKACTTQKRAEHRSNIGRCCKDFFKDEVCSPRGERISKAVSTQLCPGRDTWHDPLLYELASQMCLYRFLGNSKQSNRLLPRQHSRIRVQSSRQERTSKAAAGPRQRYTARSSVV